MEYDKVNYEKEVESAITNLLNYPLIAFNILEINDTTLQSLINDRMSFKHTLDSNFRDLFDFCTYFTVQDIIERESPYGNLYKTIVLNNQRGSSIDIGFSAFKYPLYPVITEGLDKKEIEFSTQCTVNNCHFLPDKFEKLKSKKIFYLYKFQCINNFNATKDCYRFFYYPNEEDFTPHLRRFLLETQLFFLKYIVKNPKKFATETQLYSNDRTIGFGGTVEIQNHFYSLFNQKFKHLLLERASEIRNAAITNNISISMERWL